jgi:hypothetical protein
MTAYMYRRLPVSADEGFPQSFRMTVGAGTYVVSLYVNVLDRSLLQSGQPLALPRPGAFMVMAVSRDAGATPVPLFRRKLVLRHEYETSQLAFVFQEILVHSQNLNGAGAFGSRVLGGVAERWAS